MDSFPRFEVPFHHVQSARGKIIKKVILKRLYIPSRLVEMAKELSKISLQFLNYISQDLNPTQIAHIRKKSTTAMLKMAKRLEQKGYIFIEKKSSNFCDYFVTPLGLETLKGVYQTIPEKVIQSTTRIRIHGLEVAIRIVPTMLKWWGKKLNRLFEFPDVRVVQLQNNKQGITQVGKIRVKTTSRSVLFYPNDIYAKDEFEAEQILMDIVFKTAEKINRKLSFNAYKEQWANIEITRQEIARMNDPLAKTYVKDNLKFFVSIDGKGRLIIDHSRSDDGTGMTNNPEFEAINKSHASEDMRRWETLSKGVVTGEFDFKQILERIKTLEALNEKKPVDETGKTDYIG